MFGTRKAPKRFSLLLLEEGEDYVEDWVAEARWPSNVSGNWQGLPKLQGRLRLCSKSIFFEPDDVRNPIVRLPLSQVQRMEPEGKQSFGMATQLVVKMRANMADAPYVFEKGNITSWHFHLAYAQLSAFMPVAHHYLAASRLTYAERDEALQALAKERMAAAAFDTSRLVDFTERVQINLAATQLTPLVRESGRLVVTDRRLYFQPLHNVTGDSPVRVHALADVAAVARRRSSLKPTGLEIFFIDAGGGGSATGPSVFFTFGTELERDDVAAVIADQPSIGGSLPGGRAAASACGSILEAEGGWLQRVTGAWQAGKISNRDYLLFCNLAAGRSFNDLTQWPVFPWVLADYTSAALDLNSPAAFRDLSKPIGALNPSRLDMFRERFREMPHGEGMDAPFMYGSHYSCPGYVMFWMVRAAPGHLLRLQGGRFDAPDRLFCSIKEAWDSVTTSTADVKELIPEFFLSDTSFLVNADHLALGTRQNGRAVNDVELPPWAQSPAHFLALHRAALESPFVSANLHHWIDLIFGYKQRGKAAVEADNVFHHATYGGATETGLVSRQERAALEVQINEFGQCPRQIFHSPHAPRLVCPVPNTGAAAEVAGDFATSPNKYARRTGTEAGSELSLALLATIREAVTSSTTHLDIPLEVPEMLAKLDVLAQHKQQAQMDTDDASMSTFLDPQAERAVAGNGASASLQRGAPSRLRNWSGKLGSHITQLRGTLSPTADNVSNVTTTLRGLFQRQGSGSNGNLPTFPTLPSSPEDPGREPAAADRSEQASSSQKGAVEIYADKQPLAKDNGPADAVSGLGSGAEGAAGSAEPSGSRAADAPHVQAEESGRASVLGEERAQQASAVSGGASLANKESAVDGLPFDDSGFRDPHVGSQSSSRPGTARSPPGHVGHHQERDAALWPPGFRDRLPEHPTHSIVAQQGAVNAAAAALTADGPMVYSVGQTGTLKVYSIQTGAQVRSAKLADVPCTCLALMNTCGDALSSHPIALAGCYDNKVYATQHGRPLGSFGAHDDAVSCVLAPPAADHIITASWDCSVKTWSVAEGRIPCGGQPVMATAELGEHEAAVWAMAADAHGQLLATGTEDGCVAAIDARSRRTLWQVSVSQDYIGGLQLTPDGGMVVVAAADGVASLLEMRKAGARLSHAACGAPLRCADSDGRLALLGTETGQVLFWDLGQQQGARNAMVGASAPGPDGMYRHLQAGSNAVNSLAELGGSLLTGHEDGALCIFSGRA